MGLMDKVKAAAQDAQVQAKKATAQGQEKLEDLKERRKMDDLAKQLGYLIYRERSEGTPGGSDVDRLIGEMKELDAQISSRGPQSVDVSSDAGPPAGSADSTGKQPTDEGSGTTASSDEGAGEKTGF